MTHLRSGNTASGSIMRDSALSLDFRHKPTRAEVGFTGDRNFRAYQRAGSDDLQVAVTLPGGTLRVPAFVVNIASDDTGGADDKVAHEPKVFDIERRFVDGAAARSSLLADASLLGLDQTDLKLVLPDLGVGATVPQQGVLHGLVDGWLSLDVIVSDSDNGAVQADYKISIDRYHNDAIDKVVHDGVFAIDLTHRPSRRDVGMLDSYRNATVMPAWKQTLRARLTLPGGTLERVVAAVDSVSAIQVDDDPGGVGAPKKTTVSVLPGTVEQARATLLDDAGALGIDASAVRSAFAAPAGTRVKKTLTGRQTDVFDVAVRIDAGIGQPGKFAASLSYVVSFH